VPAEPANDPSAGVWWTDALADPWRDPQASAALIRSADPGPLPALETPPPAAIQVGLRLVLLVSVLSALVAGAFGGVLGFAFAHNDQPARPSTALGRPNSSVASLTERPPDTLAGVVNEVLPSVVTVKVNSSGGYSLGSGFIASSDGYVITNDHVVEGASGVATVILSDSTAIRATVVGHDPESDIAVLKVDRAGLRAMEFGDSDAVAVGDPVLAIGSPLALSNTVTFGIVSAIDRPIESSEPGGPTRYYAAIQTDAAVNHGNSGGPLVDAGGRVIGVNSVIKSTGAADEEAGNIGLAFAIPINQAHRVAQDLIDTGRARRTVIGAEFISAEPDSGVRISAIDPAGPAAAAGLRSGDDITHFGGHPVTEPADLIALIRKYAPEDQVEVRYERSGVSAVTSVRVVSDPK
jgi:putative serine protease PepD